MSASETPSVRLPVRLLEAARALGCKLLDTAAGLHSFHGATKAQWWGIDTVRAYQDTMLRLVVEHAYRTVPYYRDLMRAAGLGPADIRCVQDLRHLPVTTKHGLRDAGYEACVSSAYRGQRLHMQSTSGSSGMPFQVYREPANERRRTGFLLRALATAGYRLGTRCCLWSNLPNGRRPAGRDGASWASINPRTGS